MRAGGAGQLYPQRGQGERFAASVVWHDGRRDYDDDDDGMGDSTTTTRTMRGWVSWCEGNACVLTVCCDGGVARWW